VELRVNASYIANFLALRTGMDATGSLVDSLNFPMFVADLLRGTVRHDCHCDDRRCLRELQHAAADALLTEIYRITRGEHC
jgi:hypothetical protein